MKIWSFIKWNLRKVTLDMTLWGIFCFCLSAHMSSKNEVYLHIAQALFLYGLVKFMVYVVKESYEKFEKEQQDLFEMIKNSDKK
jgi:hypothetical protein